MKGTYADTVCTNRWSDEENEEALAAPLAMLEQTTPRVQGPQRWNVALQRMVKLVSCRFIGSGLKSATLHQR